MFLEYLQLYNPFLLIKNLLYMMQLTSFNFAQYFYWLKRKNFTPLNFNKRRRIDYKASSMLVNALMWFMVVNIYFLFFVIDWWKAVILALTYPAIIISSSLILIILGKLFEDYQYLSAKNKIMNYRSSADVRVILVVGTYAKLSTKRILLQSLKSHSGIRSNDASTLGSIAKLFKSATTDDKIYILDLPERHKQEISSLTEIIKPEIVIVSGFSANHLGVYDSLDQLISEYRTLTDYCGTDQTFLNYESKSVEDAGLAGIPYSCNGVLNIETVDLELNFPAGQIIKYKLSNEDHELSTKLLGEHFLAPILLSIKLALNFSQTLEQIHQNLQDLKPEKHHLNVQQILPKTYLIDDTGNDNYEEFKSSLSLFQQLNVHGKKIIVTPGIPNQGTQSAKVHQQVGRILDRINPDRIYLIKNSATADISKGLGSFSEDNLHIVPDAQSFYSSLKLILAKGDVVLIQNYWPDYHL